MSSSVPRYRLCDASVNDGYAGSDHPDQRTTIYCVGGSAKITVGAERQLRSVRRGNREKVTNEWAAETAATALVMSTLQGVDYQTEDVTERVDELLLLARSMGHDAAKWTKREIIVDGQSQEAREWTYAGKWVVYCFNDEFMIFVLGPSTLRPDRLEVRKLRAEEAPLPPADEVA